MARVERLYHLASDRRPEERHSYLASVTEDEELRREVESLLANEESAAGFLETHSPESPEGELKASLPAGVEIIVRVPESGRHGRSVKALDTRMERPVVIKFLPHLLASDATALDRVQREAQLQR